MRAQSTTIADRTPRRKGLAKISQHTTHKFAHTAATARHAGCTVMTLWRWQRKHADFPKPRVIEGRAFFDLNAVDRWLAAREKR